MFQRFLRLIAAHFLWFIHNDDGAIGRNDINRLTGAKLITAGKNNTRSRITAAAFFILFNIERGIESLHINDHAGHSRRFAEVINIIELAGIIHEVTDFFVI